MNRLVRIQAHGMKGIRPEFFGSVFTSTTPLTNAERELLYRAKRKANRQHTAPKMRLVA